METGFNLYWEEMEEAVESNFIRKPPSLFRFMDLDEFGTKRYKFGGMC